MKLKLFLIMLIVLGVSQLANCETPDAVTEVVKTAASPEKSEMASALVKFCMVMAAVLLSSFIIFVGLSIWNAILKRSRSKTIDYDATLKSPQSVDEAILLFIGKNKLK